MSMGWKENQSAVANEFAEVATTFEAPLMCAGMLPQLYLGSLPTKHFSCSAFHKGVYTKLAVKDKHAEQNLLTFYPLADLHVDSDR